MAPFTLHQLVHTQGGPAVAEAEKIIGILSFKVSTNSPHTSCPILQVAEVLIRANVHPSAEHVVDQQPDGVVKVWRVVNLGDICVKGRAHSFGAEVFRPKPARPQNPQPTRHPPEHRAPVCLPLSCEINHSRTLIEMGSLEIVSSCPTVSSMGLRSVWLNSNHSQRGREWKPEEYTSLQTGEITFSDLRQQKWSFVALVIVASPQPVSSGPV